MELRNEPLLFEDSPGNAVWETCSLGVPGKENSQVPDMVSKQEVYATQPGKDTPLTCWRDCQKDNSHLVWIQLDPIGLQIVIFKSKNF